jgi:hypothetical protein
MEGTMYEIAEAVNLLTGDKPALLIVAMVVVLAIALYARTPPRDNWR